MEVCKFNKLCLLTVEYWEQSESLVFLYSFFLLFRDVTDFEAESNTFSEILNPMDT